MSVNSRRRTDGLNLLLTLYLMLRDAMLDCLVFSDLKTSGDAAGDPVIITL